MSLEDVVGKWLRCGDNPKALVTEILEKVKVYYNIQEVEAEGFVKKFWDIFPKVKLPSGKNFKSNLKDLEKKLKYFSKNYSYDPEVILEAAQEYVNHAQQNNYQYIRTAAYFVYKQGEGSDLADWCDKVLNKETHESQEPYQVFL